MMMENELPAGAGNGAQRNAANVIADNINIAKPQYSIPGILHFVQHEWARFEMERSHWEVERAELQARIAFLQGERKGQENLKRDLVRRIKMLEFALRQERQKCHKLKYGTELKLPEIKDDKDEEDLGANNDVMVNKNHDLVFNYRQGRQLLRQYLQEIGYTDKVLEMRSARVRSLLGITTDDLPNDDNANATRESRAKKIDARSAPPEGGDELDHIKLPSKERNLDGGGDSEELRTSGKDKSETGEKGGDEGLKNLNILGQDESAGAGDHDSAIDQVWSADDVDEWANMDSSKLQERIQQFKNETQDRAKKSKRTPVGHVMKPGGHVVDEEELPQSQQAPAIQVQNSPNIKVSENLNIDGGAGLGDVNMLSGRPIKQGIPGQSGEGGSCSDTAINLGELADLTVANEAGPLLNSPGRDEIRKTWGPKYTLCSHFDGVRTLSFHPYESALITGSEDHTLKLWSLQKNAQGKKGNISDLEPVYTFRGHKGMVLCCVMNGNGTVCYSGSLDSTIQCWNVPSLNIDLFGPYDPHLLGETFTAHTDAVWDLAYHVDTDRLLSCSSDGTCRLWNPSSKSPLSETYTCDDVGSPTSVSFVNTDTGQFAASYTGETAVIFDVETKKAVTTFCTDKSFNESQINKILSHPTYPLIVTAHEDRHIRFFDINSGMEVRNMVAHLDAVTSLSVDPSGLYILSGSHDGSIRLWNMENKTCIQEITAHRKKFDEAVFDVAFHPTQPYIASGGADAIAKVFV